MAWAWVENENIFVAYSEDVVPKGVAVIEVPDNATPSDLKIVNGQIAVKSETEKLSELKEQKLKELKQITYSLLQPTDWTVMKCTELGFNIADTYPDIKSKRDSIRAWNNQKEQEINNSSSIEELLNISLQPNIQNV